MKTLRLTLAIAMTGLGVHLAAAADLPPAPITTKSTPAGLLFSWTGFYVGGNVGYANGYGQDVISGNNPLSAAVVGTGVVPSSIDTAANGWLGGVQAGYNYQIQDIVLGVETDFDGAGLKGSGHQTLSTVPLGFPASLTTSSGRESNWLGTTRARIGTTFFGGGTMLYATGGMAYANVKDNTSAVLSLPGASFAAVGSDSTNKVGWTVGGGVESALSQHWTWKAEYLFVDLGHGTDTLGTKIGGTEVLFSSSQNLNEHIIRGGVNYKF